MYFREAPGRRGLVAPLLAILLSCSSGPGVPPVVPLEDARTPAQMRAVLEMYRANGGQYQELIFADCGHSPHLEKPDAFLEALTAFLL